MSGKTPARSESEPEVAARRGDPPITRGSSKKKSEVLLTVIRAGMAGNSEQ